VYERHDGLPPGTEHVDRRRWRDQQRLAARWSRPAHRVAARPPLQELLPEYEPGLAVLEDERAVRQLVERHAETRAAYALVMQLLVHRIRVRCAHERAEAVVVCPAALRARAVSRRERRRVVEEEELRVAAGLLQRFPAPVIELEPARDPPLDGVAAANPSLAVVEAAAVAVDEASVPAPRRSRRAE